MQSSPLPLDDTKLTAALKAAGSPYDAAGLRALLQGVLAAPTGLDGDAWMMLTAPRLDPDLTAALRALHGELAATPTPKGSSAADRLKAVRGALGGQGLDGFIVPHADEHQGEYVPPRAERLAWLTGFDGSAGTAVVLADSAAIFVDGRYTLQVRQQADAALYSFCHVSDSPVSGWLADHLQVGHRLGYDPWLHTQSQIERLGAACAKARVELVACDANPIDAAWRDQPPPPISPVVAHDIGHAGRDAADKRADMAKSLATERADALIVTQPDNLAWLFNIRGGDVPHTPLPLGFAILRADESAELFIDRRKLAPGTEAHLGNRVAVRDSADFGPAIDALGERGALGEGGARVMADPNMAAAWICERASAAGAALVPGADPCTLAKARKNAVEIAGTTEAHRRDGAALTRFLAWLAAEAPSGGLTESDAADELAALRAQTGALKDLSFDTISGAGPNGAIVHYRVTPQTNRALAAGTLYLVDSGAQYLDGTTDVTRTVAVGTPSPEMRDRFTRVLKGHIAIACARFPAGTTGGQLDVLARQYLWQAGLDYDHGTGHGVGSYLGVHEGPQRIAKRAGGAALEPGMIVSNEPGYYKDGAYGIRIESLVTVIEAPAPEGAERSLLGFETLTLAPIDRALIDRSLMTELELAWLDTYHARVSREIGPLVDADTRAWLDAATRPLSAA